MGFVEVCNESDVQQGKGMSVEANGTVIALFNVNGTFYAISGTCPHRGGPLGEGYLQDTTVTCPLHSWQFDVTNGKGMASVPTYPVKVENGKVFVDV